MMMMVMANCIVGEVPTSKKSTSFIKINYISFVFEIMIQSFTNDLTLEYLIEVFLKDSRIKIK